MKMKRREFIKKSTQLSTGFALGSTVSGIFGSTFNKNPLNITALIPMPIQVVIDDVGWWSGKDGSQFQEPYRTGIHRNHVPADYEAIVYLGRALGIRPQAATVMCEWDKENILRKLPTSTWMGTDWDNKKWVGPWLEEAADIIRRNQDHYELTLHGIGHEYWTEGTFTRAEWADKNGTMRPLDQVNAHLNFFEKLLQQHNLGPFPTSFVPTAFLHGFGPTGNHELSMAAVLAQHGVEYINTPFEDMFNAKSIQYDVFGIDAEVITVDRGRDLLPWNAIGTKPKGQIHGSTCGMHWPNLLHPDPRRNSEIVDEWIKLLKSNNSKFNTILAPDSLWFRHQLVQHVCSDADIAGKSIRLNFKQVDTLPGNLGCCQVTLKIKSPVKLVFNSNSIRIIKLSKQKHDVYYYTLELERMGDRKEALIKMSETDN